MTIEQPSSPPSDAAPVDSPADVSSLRRDIFALSPWRVRLAATLRSLSNAPANASVLLLSPDDSLALALADAGRPVQAAPLTPAQADFAPAPALPLADPARPLPFSDESFDSAIVSGYLEYAPDPAAALRELHRVLHQKTTVVLHVRRRRALLPALRRLSGLVDPARTPLRPGFSPSELFEALKNGFDVEETRTFGRFFTGAVDWLADLLAGVLPDSWEPGALSAPVLLRARRVRRLLSPFFALAAALDAVCFFLPSHHLVVRAKRRLFWADRITPRLRDGRSIAEAVLGSKIGTAVGK